MRVCFVRTQLGKLKKLKNIWRRPRGHHNKLRLGKKNRGPKPEIGYKKPSSQKEVRIYNPLELKGLKVNSIIIGAGVGKKKKAEIAKECEKMKILIKNPPKKIIVKAKKAPEKGTKK